MLLKQRKNLLPKRLTDGVALKTLTFQQQLLRSGGLKKLLKITTFSKITIGGVFLLYFAGYQPTLAIPPVKKSVVYAEFSQEQTIDVSHFPEPFRAPHPGYISNRFSSWHQATDIATGLGMPIHPIASGEIIQASFDLFGLGNFVTVKHQQNFQSTYAHMAKIFVKKGDLVTSTSILGEVGLTGRTTGPHTHLEVSKDSHFINPETILPPIPAWNPPLGKAPVGNRQELSVKKVTKKPEPTPYIPEFPLLSPTPTLPLPLQLPLALP